MLKAYIGGWKEREEPNQQITDYWFAERPENAARWPTRGAAESDCVVFNYHRIVIPSSQGGTHVCDDFKVEERSGVFVVFCVAPFISKDTSKGESTAQEKPLP